MSGYNYSNSLFHRQDMPDRSKMDVNLEKSKFQEYVGQTRETLDKLPNGAFDFELRLQAITLQLLAEGKPIPPEDLAAAWNMPFQDVKPILEQARALGTLQFNDQGNLIASALSLVPTQHIFRTKGITLYSWCAFDAVYAPGVIGEVAEIESVDPLSQEAVRLVVSPDGVLEKEPEEIAVTVVGLDADTRGGASSPRCRQMQFFTTSKNAHAWKGNSPGVSVMTVDQLFEFANLFLIEPVRQMGILNF